MFCTLHTHFACHCPCFLQFLLFLPCFPCRWDFRTTVTAQVSFLVASEAPRSAGHREGTAKREDPGSFDAAVTGAEGKALCTCQGWGGGGRLLLPSLPASSLLSSHLQETLGKCLQEEMQKNKETLESAVKVGVPIQALRLCPGHNAMFFLCGTASHLVNRVIEHYFVPEFHFSSLFNDHSYSCRFIFYDVLATGRLCNTDY